MKILSKPPFEYKTGSLMDPNDVNQNQQYMLRAIAECGSKRFSHTPVVLPYYTDCATGYSQADSSEKLSYRFSAMDTVWLEHAFLDGYVSGTATINLYDTATGLAPSGVVNPILSASGTTFDLTGQVIQLDAGHTYRFGLEGTSFSTTKLDLVLHFRSDRFNTAGTDTLVTPSVTSFTEASPLSATTFNANVSAINNAVTSNTGKTRAAKPMVFIAQNFTPSTDGYLLQWTIPVVDTSVYRSKVVKMDVFALYSTAGSAGNQVTWTLNNASGVSTGLTASADMNGVTFATASSSTSVALESATTGAQSNTSKDFSLTVSTNAHTVVKSYAVLWIE